MLTLMSGAPATRRCIASTPATGGRRRCRRGDAEPRWPTPRPRHATRPPGAGDRAAGSRAAPPRRASAAARRRERAVGLGAPAAPSPAATRSKSARSGTSRRTARSSPATTIAIVHQVSSDGHAYRCSMALDFQIVTRYQFSGEVRGNEIMIYENSFEVLAPNACKLALAILPGALAVIAAAAVLDLKRDSADFEADQRSDDLAIARVLADTVGRTWEDGGQERARSRCWNRRAASRRGFASGWVDLADADRTSTLSPHERAAIARGEEVLWHHDSDTRGWFHALSPVRAHGSVVGADRSVGGADRPARPRARHDPRHAPDDARAQRDDGAGDVAGRGLVRRPPDLAARAGAARRHRRSAARSIRPARRARRAGPRDQRDVRPARPPQQRRARRSADRGARAAAPRGSPDHRRQARVRHRARAGHAAQRRRRARAR